MSGIEALGFVCNIMQTISFAHETVTLCKAIYQGRHPDAYLIENAASLAALSAQVQTHYQKMKPQTTDEWNLSNIASKCNITARALEEEVQFITDHQTKGNLAATLRIAVKMNWRKSRLERLEKSLREHRSTMESYLLARVW